MVKASTKAKAKTKSVAKTAAKAAAKPKAKPKPAPKSKAKSTPKTNAPKKAAAKPEVSHAANAKSVAVATHKAAPQPARSFRAPIKEVSVSEGSMTKKEMQHFEKLLLDERARLLGSIRNIEEASRQEAGRDNNGDLTSYAETGTDNFELETALNIASGESEWLRNIADALRRIQEGTYGTCEMCELAILKKRLEVFPSARYCIKCQAEFEKRRSGGDGFGPTHY